LPRATCSPQVPVSNASGSDWAIADKIADPGYQASFLGHVPENARTLALADA
jgi:hypothetical protein